MRYLRWLLVLIPVAILAELLHWSEVLLFVTSALAVIPLAGLMGEATEALAEKTGLDPRKLLCWANGADRMRVKGVSKEYCELLQAAGVDTVRELKHRNAAKLAKAMAEANRQRRSVRLLPSEAVVARWIESAKKLPMKIS